MIELADRRGAERLDRSTVAALGAMSLAVFIIANDFTSLSVALPRIERSLGIDLETVQWVMNGYSVVFGVLLVTGGRLGDVFGRRRAFFVGITIFGLCSVAAAAATGSALLIGARAAMGIGAALIWPAVVGLIFGMLPPARQGMAGGLVLGVAGIGNALGPMIGGALTDQLSWRWILILNVPIALVTIALVYLRVDRDPPRQTRERLDWPGVAALTVGLVALLVALDQASDWGWGDSRIVALLLISAVGLAALVLTQRRAGDAALIPRDVIGTRAFASACVTVVLVTGIWFSVLLYVPQYTERILGFSAFRSGVAFLPLLLVFSTAAFAAGPLYDRIGPRLPLLCGTAAFPIGGLLLSLVGVHSIYAAMLPGLVITGLGVGLFYTTITNAAVGTLSTARTGVGSGLIFMFQLVSGAIGVGLATTVFTAASRPHSATRAGFVAGLHAGLRVDAAIALCGLFTVWAVVRSGAPGHERPPAVEIAPT